MRRRLDLGASLVGSPRLLLLDEPTTGLDPASRNEVWDGIRAMGKAGTDILLTTQYLDEADHLAASIVIIDEGRVIAQGTPGELKSRAGADMVELHTNDIPPCRGPPRSSRRWGLANRRPTPPHGAARSPLPSGSKLLPAVVRALDDAGVAVEDIGLRRPTLDEVFLALTGPTPTCDRGRQQGERGMTIDITLDTGRPRPDVTAAAQPGASYLVASRQVAARTLKKFVRTPALIVAGTAQGVLFLLIFRYVFGGAVAHTGASRTSTSWFRGSSSPASCSRGWARPAASPTTWKAGSSIGCAACRSACCPW